MGCGASRGGGGIPVFGGRFEAVEDERLGSGSFGRVYVGIDRKSAEDDPKRQVAIKIERDDAPGSRTKKKKAKPAHHPNANNNNNNNNNNNSSAIAKTPDPASGNQNAVQKQDRAAHGESGSADLAKGANGAEGTTIAHEAMVYRDVRALGIAPRLLWVGRKRGHRALVLSLLGPSWEDVLRLSPHTAGMGVEEHPHNNNNNNNNNNNGNNEINSSNNGNGGTGASQHSVGGGTSPRGDPRVADADGAASGPARTFSPPSSPPPPLSPTSSTRSHHSQSHGHSHSHDPLSRQLVRTLSSGPRRHVLSDATVLVLALRALEGLEKFHSSGWVHRDVKPANFLMPINPDEPRVYLVDFGLSQRRSILDEQRHAWSSRVSQTASASSASSRSDGGSDIDSDDDHSPLCARRVVAGTPMFMSPAMHTGRPACAWDDLVSLGYSMVFLLEGTLPWSTHVMDEAKVARLPLARQNWIARCKGRFPPEVLCSRVHTCFAEALVFAMGGDPDAGVDYVGFKAILECGLRDVHGSTDDNTVVMDWHQKRKRRGGRRRGSKSSAAGVPGD